MKKNSNPKSYVLTLLIFTILFSCSVYNISNANAEGLSKKTSEVKMAQQVKASHILVSTKEEAIKIKEEILAGLSFDDAAAQYSQCPSGQNGGDLGYFEKGQMVPEFEHVAFLLPVGEISEPIQTQFGWHLILVTDKK